VQNDKSTHPSFSFTIPHDKKHGVAYKSLVEKVDILIPETEVFVIAVTTWCEKVNQKRGPNGIPFLKMYNMPIR
jgi:hypothetical protein